MVDQNLVEVFRARNAPAAHLLKGALEEAGIRSVIEGEMLQGALGEVPLGWASSPRLLVESRDESKAREIIHQREKTSSESLTIAAENGSVCLSCGAVMGEEVETCPVCGWSYKNGDS